jgi:hypothetical protein
MRETKKKIKDLLYQAFTEIGDGSLQSAMVSLLHAIEEINKIEEK